MSHNEKVIIGGHDGLSVYRTPQGIIKEVNYVGDKAEEWHEMNMVGIHNEAYFLRELEGCGYTPRLLEESDEYIIEEDVGIAETPTSIQALMRHCCRMLNTFRSEKIRHIDLTWPNVVVRDNHPWAIDWQQSRHYDQVPNEQERWETDSATVWRWMSVIKDTRGVNDESRIVRRWYAVLGGLGALYTRVTPLNGRTFLDVGCFQGDHVAMARCEGMEAEGVDFGGFRSGENSIEIAKQLFKGMGCKFTQEDIMDLPASYFERDVVVMFSTWPYIVHKHSKAVAEKLLEIIIERAGIFFFETQLYGDGPGPEFLTTEDDVDNMLRRCGAKNVWEILSLPVYGRVAERTVKMCAK